MATVTVTIDGKAYRMACDEGQEQHLTGLAERFDRYVTHLKSSFGEIGDQRLTVMAGIMVMDELTELQKRMKGLENEAETLRKAERQQRQQQMNRTGQHHRHGSTGHDPLRNQFCSGHRGNGA